MYGLWEFWDMSVGRGDGWNWCCKSCGGVATGLDGGSCRNGVEALEDSVHGRLVSFLCRDVSWRCTL
jgi:hypothetical protein